MLVQVLTTLFVLGPALGSKPCVTDELCGGECPHEGLHIGKCLQEKCFCVALPGKRGTNEYMIEGACDSNDDCHKRCAPTGMFFGKCLIDKCFCYTLMGKRSVLNSNICTTSADCEGRHTCGGEFRYAPLCMRGVCGCGFAETG